MVPLASLSRRVLLDAGPEYVVVVKVEHVHGLGDGQGLVAPHDHQVVVVTVRGLVSEVVAAGDDGAVLRVAGVDDEAPPEPDRTCRYRGLSVDENLRQPVITRVVPHQ